MSLILIFLQGNTLCSTFRAECNLDISKAPELSTGFVTGTKEGKCGKTNRRKEIICTEKVRIYKISNNKRKKNIKGLSKQ